MAEDRVRVWTCILYPDDLEKNNIDLITAINNLHIPCLLSPLHDPDNVANKKLIIGVFDPDNVRKPHHHLMLSFDGKKSSGIVKSYLYEQFPKGIGCSIPLQVSSPKGLARYFIHLDNPEKQQFKGKWAELQCFGGFKVDDFLEPSSSEKYRYIKEMMQFCNDNEIYEISDLMNICNSEYPDTWGYILCMTSTNVMKTFLDSKRYKHEQYCKKQREIAEHEKDKIHSKKI